MDFRILLFLILFPLCGNTKSSYKRTIVVHNLKEFVQALNDDTEIILEMDKLDVSQRRMQLFVPKDNERIQTDGSGFNLYGFRNLKISAANQCDLFVDNIDDIVLQFESCLNIVLENLNLYHVSEENSSCNGEVVYFYDCKKITITNCSMNGSGLIGLYLNGVSTATIKDSRIFNNSDHMIVANQSDNIHFINTSFYENNTYYDAIRVENDSEVYFHNCQFHDNYSNASFIAPIEESDKTAIHFDDCTFENINEGNIGYVPEKVFNDDQVRLIASDYETIREKIYSDESIDATETVEEEPYYEELETDSEQYYNELPIPYYILTLDEWQRMERVNIPLGTVKSYALLISERGDQNYSNELIYDEDDEHAVQKINIILQYLSWENEKKADNIGALDYLCSFPMKRYWNKENVTKTQLADIYEANWKLLVASRNIPSKLWQQDENNFILELNYIFIPTKTLEVQEVKSSIQFTFKNDKINSVSLVN